MDHNDAERIMHSLQNERAKLLAGLNSNPYKRQEYEKQLSQIEENIQQLHFTVPAYNNSPHRTNNSPSGAMDKFQPNQVTQDSGIATRVGSPGFDDDDSSTGSGSVMCRWDQAAQGTYEPPYPTPRDIRSEPKMSAGSKGDRLTAAMFPETVEQNGMQTTQIDTTQPSNIQRLSEPSQEIKQSLSELLKYQTDTEVTNRAIPELLRVLQHPEREVLEKAAMVVDTLAKNDASRQAILSSAKLLTALINAVGKNVNDGTAKYVANTLMTLSSKPHGIKLIHSCDGISFLLYLLKSEMEHIVMFAITCLHNMFMCQHNSSTYKEVFRNKGGIQHLVRLLNGNRVKILAIISDCLHMLACNNDETKLTIYTYNGPVLLVKILTENNYEKLLWTTGRLLKVLVHCMSNKHAIVQAGGLPALSKHLTNSTPRICQLYLRLLLSLSDIARPEENLEPMIVMLLNLLQGKCDVNVLASAAGILSNITCNNPQNKSAICEHNGIPILINIVTCYTQKTDVSINTPQLNELLEGIICTLRHVTARHQRAEVAQNEVRLQKGLNLILQLFLTTTHWTLIKACLGLLRNLSLNSTNRSELRRLLVIPQLIELLRRSLDILIKSADEGDYMPQDGVNMEDVLVLVLSTVEILSRDAINRHMIGKQDIIPLLVRLLFSEHKRLLEHAAGCLCELAQDVYNIQVMERENCAEAMSKLMQRTPDETIVAYAAMTLHRLNEHRSLDSQKMLSDEMLPVMMPMIPPGPGNVTPIGDLDYYAMTEDPSFNFFNPEQNAYMQTPTDLQLDHGHCIHPNPHTMTPSIQTNHAFPDPRVNPSPYYLEKPDYYEMTPQQMQIPPHQQGAYFPQELGYGYNPLLDFPPQTMREYYPTQHDASSHNTVFRQF